MSERSAITKNQKHILRHALGLTRGKQSYRNHFVTGPGSTDYTDCCALVANGYMWRTPGSFISGGDDVFTVTDEGKEVAND